MILVGGTGLYLRVALEGLFEGPAADAALRARLTAEAERALAIRLSSQRSDVQILFALAIFLSAFLLFQVELLLGKQILPIFGGAPAVWTTCLLVFQLLLLNYLVNQSPLLSCSRAAYMGLADLRRAWRLDTRRREPSLRR